MGIVLDNRSRSNSDAAVAVTLLNGDTEKYNVTIGVTGKPDSGDGGGVVSVVSGDQDSIDEHTEDKENNELLHLRLMLQTGEGNNLDQLRDVDYRTQAEIARNEAIHNFIDGVGGGEITVIEMPYEYRVMGACDDEETLGS